MVYLATLSSGSTAMIHEPSVRRDFPCAVTVTITVFWNMTPCTLVNVTEVSEYLILRATSDTWVRVYQTTRVTFKSAVILVLTSEHNIYSGSNPCLI
jgi:hypothetical protein